MIKKTMALALCLGLTSVYAIASNNNNVPDDFSSNRADHVLLSDAPTQRDLQVNELREPHRKALTEFLECSDTLTNNLAFMIGEMTIKSRMAMSNLASKTYVEAELDIVNDLRMKKMDGVCKELTGAVNEILLLRPANSTHYAA